MQIVILGDLIIDEYIYYETVRPCPEGDFPLISWVDTKTRPGGAGAVREMVLALGAEVALWEWAISSSRISRKTRVVIDGKVVYRIDDDKDSDYAKVLAGKIETNRLLDVIALVADYGKGAIDRTVIEAGLKKGWQVIADPHITTDPSVFEGVWAVTPNRREDAEGNYWSKFARVCLKLDEDGVMFHEFGPPSPHGPHGPQGRSISSTAKTPIVDVCGAGDQILAALGVQIAQGASWIDACIYANAAAGLCCGKHGTTAVTLAEMGDFKTENPYSQRT